MTTQTVTTELDLDAICADLDTRRQYAEAGKQPSVATFLTDSLIDRVPVLVAEVRRLRGALTQIAGMCECRRGDMCGSAVAHYALHGPGTE